MLSKGIIATLIVAATFALVRISGVTNVFFKDAAHLYVGGLFGAAIVLWSLSLAVRIQIKSTLEVRQGFTSGQTDYIVQVVEQKLHAVAKFYLGLGIVLSVIETLVAVISRVL